MDLPQKSRSASHDHSPRRWGTPLWIHAWVWAVCAALVLGLIAVSARLDGRDVWRGRIESGELRQPGYAERIYRADFFRTRANTWSNLAFVVVGFYAIAHGWADLRPKRTQAEDGFVVTHPVMSVLFGVSCCGLGGGSGLYHASLTRWGQQLDVASMYPPLLVCIAINVGRRSRGTGLGAGVSAHARSWLLASAVVAVSLLLYRYKWSMSAALVLTTLILTVGACGLWDLIFKRRELHFRWLGWATGALAVGIFCRQLDVAGKFSGPDAWLQGHAVWHVLTALSLAFTYVYYRSERGSSDLVARSARG